MWGEGMKVGCRDGGQSTINGYNQLTTVNHRGRRGQRPSRALQEYLRRKVHCGAGSPPRGGRWRRRLQRPFLLSAHESVQEFMQFCGDLRGRMCGIWVKRCARVYGCQNRGSSLRWLVSSRRRRCFGPPRIGCPGWSTARRARAPGARLRQLWPTH